MNAAHFHLIINHVPLFITVVSILILTLGLILKNEVVKKMALAGFIIAGIFVIVVFESGESAEEIVEEIPAVLHGAIEEHEEAAAISRWLTILLGLGGITGLVMMKRESGKLTLLLSSLVLLGILTFVSLAYTSFQGGKIRHTEIESGSTPTSSSIPSSPSMIIDSQTISTN